MNRIRLTGMLAIGLTCLLLSPPAQASRPDATAKGSGIVPLSADQQISRGGQQQVTNHIYRDSKGRIRVESGSTVTISDPTTGTTIRLDTASRTFQRSTRQQPAARPSTTTKSQPLASPPRSLGTAQVQGVAAQGRAYTVTTPGLKGRPGKSREVTIWLSTEVQLPVQTRVTDATGQAFTQAYTNIRAGVEPAAQLFTVPAGYQELADPPTHAKLQEACPIYNNDPVILESFGPFLGAGVANAVTNPDIGCIFVADGGVFDPPLAGFPTVPLGSFLDQWYVFDDGSDVPFLPWVAFGDVAFAAANQTDLTIKDTLVILTIFEF
jgi:outer membrane lipoprotein-sorting protein